MKHPKKTLLYAAAELFRSNQIPSVTTNPESAFCKSRRNKTSLILTCTIILLGVLVLADGTTNWLLIGFSAFICVIHLLFLWLNRTTLEQKMVAVTWKPVRERLIEHVIQEAQAVDGPSPTGTLRMILHRMVQDPYGDPGTQERLEEVARELGIKIEGVTLESV